MVFGKYTRLPSKDLEFSELKFDALDGPSYFSYGGQQGKYRSVFTYSSLNSTSSAQDPEERKQSVGCLVCYKVVTIVCYLIFLTTLPLSLLFTLKTVRGFERMVIFRLGRYLKTAGPGYAIVLPCIDSWKRVDMRMKAFSVPPQKVITADNAVIEMGAEVFYNVVDPLRSVNSIQDLNHSTRIISQISLQKCIGRRNLSEIETSRQNILDILKEDVNETTKLWGVEVAKVELSSPKLYSKPNHLANHTNNPLSFLGPVLFPPGSSNPPVEQLQHFFTMAGKEAGNKVMQNPTQYFISPVQTNAYLSASNLMNSVEELIKKVSPQLNHNLVKDFGLLYKFIITSDAASNEENGIFYLDLKVGEGQVGTGYPFLKEADVVLTMTKTVLEDLMSGKLNPFNAFMSSQLSVSGNLKGAMKLGNLIENLKKN